MGADIRHLLLGYFSPSPLSYDLSCSLVQVSHHILDKRPTVSLYGLVFPLKYSISVPWGKDFLAPKQSLSFPTGCKYKEYTQGIVIKQSVLRAQRKSVQLLFFLFVKSASGFHTPKQEFQVSFSVSSPHPHAQSFPTYIPYNTLRFCCFASLCWASTRLEVPPVAIGVTTNGFELEGGQNGLQKLIRGDVVSDIKHE